MKNNLVFLYSNNLKLSCNIAREVCGSIGCDIYIVEDEAALMLIKDGWFKETIIAKYGEESYISDKLNLDLFGIINSSGTDEMDNLQTIMNDTIIFDLKDKTNKTIVVSNQIIETGILHLSNN